MSASLPFKTSIDDSALRAPSTPARAGHLSTIARTFRVDPTALRTVNGLGPDATLPSQLFIPAMKTDDVAQPAAASEPGGSRQHLVRFAWPVHGTITQYFWEYHPGIDIANDVGTPEFAADAGKVVFAG